jgi:fatty-acyl-CoA synthase
MSYIESDIRPAQKTEERTDNEVSPYLFAYPDADFAHKLAEFDHLAAALDHAAEAGTGMNFYNARGRLFSCMRYDEIRARAHIQASRMLSMGLRRGDRVGIIADMEPDFITLFFACQYAGLISVPLPVITGLGGRQGYRTQLARVLETSGARLALGADTMLEDLKHAAQNTDTEFVITPGMLDQYAPSDQCLQPLGAHEQSHIQYSSGSTRYPLGIEISQAALMANARSVATDALKLSREERVASWLPFYHDMGLIGCMIIPVTCQFTVDYMHTDAFARRPLQWLKLISENRCTISFAPTFGYELCIRRAERARDMGLDLSCWRVAGVGGEMIQPCILDNFVEVFGQYGFDENAFEPSYGLAEATLAFSFARLKRGVRRDCVDRDAMSEHAYAAPADHDSVNIRNFASCGQPMNGYKVEIRDAMGKPLPERYLGRVYIKAPSLMNAYFQNPEATRERIDAHGWLDTGDMGYMADGELFITGRQKDLIIVNGRNIWPQDLEWEAEDGVDDVRPRDTAAFSIDGENGREIPVILVQCRMQDEAGRKKLRNEVHATLFRNNGIDCRVVLIPHNSLPYTTSGKLSRAKAKKAYLEGAFFY